MQPDHEERRAGQAEREVRAVGVGGDTVSPRLVVLVVQVLKRTPEQVLELELVIRNGFTEAGDERHEVSLDVDLVGVAGEGRSQEVEAASAAGVGEVVEDDEGRSIAPEHRPSAEAGVLGVGHHLLDSLDDVACWAVAKVLGGALLEQVLEALAHRTAAERAGTVTP